jgi:hypothetical protein
MEGDTTATDTIKTQINYPSAKLVLTIRTFGPLFLCAGRIVAELSELSEYTVWIMFPTLQQGKSPELPIKSFSILKNEPTRSVCYSLAPSRDVNCEPLNIYTSCFNFQQVTGLFDCLIGSLPRYSRTWFETRTSEKALQLPGDINQECQWMAMGLIHALCPSARPWKTGKIAKVCEYLICMET